MENIRYNLYIKIGAIVIITLLLLIPTAMIKSLIQEREDTQEAAISEVSSKWSGEQTISGPFITIPYYKYVKKYSEKDSTTKVVRVRDHLHILPSELNIEGEIKPEKRYRGIYEIVVYNSEIGISGVFNTINLSKLDINKEDLLLDKASLNIGINDLRGIQQQVKLTWNENQASFNSGVTSNDVISSGINANVAMVYNDSASYNFSLKLDLRGSQLLYFTPVGKVTDVNVSSDWQTPSFNGAFLPDTRDVNQEGFKANWNVLHLNRNYPQSWTGGSYKIGESAFGIDLLLPVDNYQKSYRSIKYAILFIVFTFLVFFFIEVFNKIAIHPVQYILVGIALVVFYTLLLSLSEHLKYNMAFIVSALATLALVSAYVRAILKSGKLTMLMGGILAVLYAFIFTIIQLEDYALLIGSIGIFLILAIVMYFSRRIDWYDLNLNREEDAGTDKKVKKTWE